MCQFEDGEEIEIPNINQYGNSLISGESTLMLPKQKIENDNLSSSFISEFKDSLMKNANTKIENKNTGTRTLVAIRVDALDSSTTMTKKQIRKRLFGKSSKIISLKSQYSKCSFKQLKFKPFHGKTLTNAVIKKGVGEVSIPMNTTNATKAAVVNAIEEAVAQKYGKLKNQVNHFMYILPPGTGDWLATGVVNGKKSVCNDLLGCDNLSVLMHEIGHNLNLYHSGEGNRDYVKVGEGNTFYADESCYMGFGSYNLDLMEEGIDIQKCFNGAKSWHLNWYNKGQILVNPDSPFFEGNLIGVVYFDQLQSDKVIVKIEGSELDYYVAFNHRAKFNSMSIEGQDLVLVTSRKSGNKPALSKLEAKLDEGDSYNVEGN